MPASIQSPSAEIPLRPLTREAFAPFGSVIQNPARAPQDPASAKVAANAVEANQGSAVKYLDVSHLVNYYGRAPSGTPARAVVNMFVCKPRQLKPATGRAGRGEGKRLFNVRILERHPYTPQTFVPAGLAGADAGTKYLVIVAPTLPSQSDAASQQHDPSRPSPGEPAAAEGEAPQPKGSGPPDLARLQAFLADGSQAVTYGPGTWHAPMVVVGEQAVDFVVFQYANGCGEEDCQEVLLAPDGGTGGGISVVVDRVPGLWKPRL